jgi:hypothetical protein
MPKYEFQWKDPDYYDAHVCENGHFTDEEYKELRKLGIGEYLCVKVDTEAGTVEVVRPKNGIR